MPGQGIPSTSSSTLPKGSGLVLVVDDEASVRHYTKRLLERAGFQVLTASDGSEGIEFFKSHLDEVKIAVVDMSMCNMDGLETMRRLREFRPSIPVVIMSGYNESQVQERPGGRETSGYIQKPFRPGEFLSMVCGIVNPPAGDRTATA
jgi:two-component system cell cycle sensor histidine kinase/response regulator CckA